MSETARDSAEIRRRGSRTAPRAVQALLALSVVCSSLAYGSSPSKPNFVVLLADDLGYSDLGCYGGEIQTPNLDRLAGQGLRFTNFYNCGRCSPTRASLITGQYPHEVGVGWTVRSLTPSGYRGRLNKSTPTIPKGLRAQGYSTMLVGKWHLRTDPCSHGFDRFFGTRAGPHGHRAASGFEFDGEPVLHEGEWWATEQFTDVALELVEECVQEARPFFLYVAYSAPHWPLQAQADHVDLYSTTYQKGWLAVRSARMERLKELGLVPKDTEPSPLEPSHLEAEDSEDHGLRMAYYAAQVHELDQQIGRLIESFEKQGILENTLVMFLSDNGASAEGGANGITRGEGALGSPDLFASYGGRWASVSNTPFRGFKHQVFEGGIATPCIMHWPAGIQEPGRLVRAPVHLIDLAPTLFEAAGADPGEEPGQSLRPLFGGQSFSRNEPLFWEHEGNRAVRFGRWKLVAPFRKDWHLYDLALDPTERRDLASENPERVAQLVELYERWAEENRVLDWAEVRPRKR